MLDAQDRAWYAALKAKDARFDGRFFVGVSSTGIYCRPVCRAKLPKPENCSFYTSAASAEQAGFRPCLLCRPELAPGAAPVDATGSLAQRAARLLEENCGSGQTLEEFVIRLGCSDRHLRRAFAKEYSVSPVQYLQTCRLLLAKSLLTDTKLSILDIAMASGFGSLRRMNDLFKKQYRLAPSALRRQLETLPQNDNITLALGFRPPYQWKQMLNFLSARAMPGVELVRGNEYVRTVQLVKEDEKRVCGWVRIGLHPQNNTLAVTINSALLSVLPQVLARVRHLFDLHCDPAAVHEALKTINEIRPGVCALGTRLPGCFDAFEMTVQAILGQQATVKAANALAGKFVESFGTPVATEIKQLTHVFPAPCDITALGGAIVDRLALIGISAAQANSILALARAFEQKEVDFNSYASAELELQKLLNLPGIGPITPWTAQYIAMRAMAWPDAFPHTDHEVKKALGSYTEKEILSMAETWRPWRSYAAINLWNSL